MSDKTPERRSRCDAGNSQGANRKSCSPGQPKKQIVETSAADPCVAGCGYRPMACFHPIKGFRARLPGPNGKRKIVFDVKKGFEDLPVTLPCGQCRGCRLERSRQWAIRCSHEASLYSKNCFITLTYADAYLPPTGSLDITHFQKFMKRLRKKNGTNIRFYHCGEYGEKFRRPHYHACVFNYDPKDRKIYKTINKQKLYTSESLAKLWPYGMVIVGDVTFKSAAYVARYIMKKISGPMADKHYRIVDPETGEITAELAPEYTTMSRRPGIGQGWLEKYKYEPYPDDFVVINGKKMRPAKYYDRQYEVAYPSDYESLRGQRVRNAKKHAENNTPARLKVREQVLKARTSILKRELE